MRQKALSQAHPNPNPTIPFRRTVTIVLVLYMPIPTQKLTYKRALSIVVCSSKFKGGKELNA